MLNLPRNIEGQEIKLRLLDVKDEQPFHALTNDPKIADIISFLSYPVPRSFTDAWIARNRGIRDRIYGIISREGVLMGGIGAHLTETANEVEIGYWVGTAFWGCGVATQAVRMLAKILTELMPENAVFAECLPDNLTVLARAGEIRILKYRTTGA